MNIEQLRTCALSLPGTSEEPHFNYASFRVKGKIFATVPPDGKFAHIFLDDEQRDLAVALHPECVEMLTWGKKLVGVRVSWPRPGSGSCTDSCATPGCAKRQRRWQSHCRAV